MSSGRAEVPNTSVTLLPSPHPDEGRPLRHHRGRLPAVLECVVNISEGATPR